MDTVIQSQLQSALVQKLSETEHNLKRFTKDLPDNAPLMSFSKEEISPYIGTSEMKEGAFRFKVPRRGHLNRMWMKVRELQSVNREYLYAAGEGMEYFGNFFESASLFINGKRIETLYVESIMYNVLTRNSGMCVQLMRGLKGVRQIEAIGPPKEDFMRERAFYSDASEEAFYLAPNGNRDYIIPLDFSMFRFFKDSLDTNFLGKIEVEFNKKAGHVVTNPNVLYPSLVCKYHNFLNHFRTNVRNANFSKDTSTKLITNSHLVTTTPIYDGAFNYTYEFETDKDVTDILFAFHSLDDSHLNMGCDFKNGEDRDGDGASMKIVIKINDKVIVEKRSWEMIAGDSNIGHNDVSDVFKGEFAMLDFQNTDFSVNNEGDPRTEERVSMVSDEFQRRRVYAPRTKRPPVILSQSLRMFGTDEFYNGALNGKSLGKISISITAEGFVIGPDATHTQTPRIVLRYNDLVRIDSKTGVVSV